MFGLTKRFIFVNCLSVKEYYTELKNLQSYVYIVHLT